MDTGAQSSQKRIKKKIKHPNPLFEKWLKEWQDEARERGSDIQYCYAKALRSLKKYPLPLRSGKECRILQNFGTKICDMLDRKLEEVGHMRPEESPDFLTQDVSIGPCASKPKSQVRRKSKSAGQTEQKTKLLKSAKNRTTSRSGKSPENGLNRPVHELSPDDSEDNVTDNQLPNCEQISSGSFENIETNMVQITSTSACTHLSDVRSLIHREVVNYDVEIKRCASAVIPTSSFTTITQKEEQVTQLARGYNKTMQEEWRQLDEPVLPALSTFKLPGGSFRIVLLVDVSETTGNHLKQYQGALIAELKRLQVNVEVRHLNVGDFAWICQDNSKNEAVLPYIVERKRTDDFAKSIKDGRFHEQKFRLKRCGVQNRIYLVESHGNNQHVGLPLSTIEQAAANTHVVDEFIITRTPGPLGTIKYLSCVTNFITRTFKDKMIVSCPKEHLPPLFLASDTVSLMAFSDFNGAARKKMQYTVKEMFIKQLVQLYGMSVSKALAVVQIYPSPSELMKAYAQGGGDDLLSNILYGKTRRKIGPALSKTIYQFYTHV
ncbi:crossover junction endonuclease MUS81 isoform X1 [Schistocerca americana]|uniref:crossover junction endonuclease MUS81 isoform X1 n=1 Tax=Schistocerca americana TaxID=7009 RepID=UPI001F4F9414|nr:crossover junction endonuclease MUS81 isoform X1 [Schistocerca americana]